MLTVLFFQVFYWLTSLGISIAPWIRENATRMWTYCKILMSLHLKFSQHPICMKDINRPPTALGTTTSHPVISTHKDTFEVNKLRPLKYSPEFAAAWISFPPAGSRTGTFPHGKEKLGMLAPHWRHLFCRVKKRKGEKKQTLTGDWSLPQLSYLTVEFRWRCFISPQCCRLSKDSDWSGSCWPPSQFWSHAGETRSRCKHVFRSSRSPLEYQSAVEL